MRLSDILSKAPSIEYEQIEGFMNGKGVGVGKSRKISVGKIALNYFCKTCNDQRTFLSSNELFCIGVNEKTISIDSVLKCPCCGASVETWFLIESTNKISDTYPNIRIIKKNEKLSLNVSLNKLNYGDFTEMLEKAKRASYVEFGAGSIVYLRTIFETVFKKIGQKEQIEETFIDKNGITRHKTFERYLKEVDQKKHIIPREFADNGYDLFRELSNVVHGNCIEEEALEKFDAFYRLVVGVLDNIKISNELMEAVDRLGWQSGDLA